MQQHAKKHATQPLQWCWNGLHVHNESHPRFPSAMHRLLLCVCGCFVIVCSNSFAYWTIVAQQVLVFGFLSSGPHPFLFAITIVCAVAVLHVVLKTINGTVQVVDSCPPTDLHHADKCLCCNAA